MRVDCGHNDNFHTNPTPGSFLATHWNAAYNRFLIADSSGPVVDVSPPPPPIADSSPQPTVQEKKEKKEPKDTKKEKSHKGKHHKNGGHNKKRH